MSTPEYHRLTLACRVTRWRAALFDASLPSVRAHCSSCAECRSYFETADQLESTLRNDAAPARATASGTFEARILNTVKHSQRPAPRLQRSASWPLAAVAVAAAIAIVAIFRIQDQPAVNPRQPDASIEDVLAVANELPRQLLAAIQPNAVKLLEQNSLRTEIALVGSDARSALDFLALNFMPSSSPSRPASNPQSG